MKLDKLKTLFKAKRILALALAAAMTVTSLPQTAYAAEAQAPETETAVEVQEEDEQPAENTEETDNSAEENKESVSLETETEENASSTTQAAEMETTEATGTSEAQEVNVTEAANQAEGDNTPAEITYKLENKLEDDAEIKTASYDGSSHFVDGSGPAYGILSQIEVQGNGSFEGTLWNLSNGFTFKWQKEGTDSAAEDTDPALLPVNAGKYQLVITPKTDGTYANAGTLTITGFVVEQAEVEIDFDFKGGSVAPGTAKEKVVDYIEDVYVDSIADSFSYDPEDENTKLKIEVKVIDPFTNNETGDASLKKTGDYLAQVTVSFSDKASDEEKGNYNLPQSLTKKIEVADLKATTITFDVADAKDAVRSDNGKKVKVITQAYGSEVKVPSYTNVKIEEEEAVLDKDGNEQHNPVTSKEGDVTGKWHSAKFRSWTETEKVAEKNEDGTDKTDDNGDIVYKNEIKTLCSLTVGDAFNEGETPVNAGTYVYRVTYAGDKDQYAESYADIVVEITPIEVEVKPAGDNKYYIGETVKDVLSKISYEPINAESIWGTSYDKDHQTQSYEPLFGVYKVKNGEAELLGEADKLTEEKDVTYEVRFTGKKIVRYADGSVSGTKNINDAQVDSFNSNYLTKTDVDTLAANKLVLELSDVKVTIDTTDITSDAALQAAGLKKSDITIDGNTIYTKVYSDNGALYNTRAEYKKAKAGEGELTYKWYKWTPSDNYAARYDLKNAHVAVFNKELNFNSNWTSLAVNNNDFASVKNSLSNAGIYKLQITYDDGSAYAQENIYYAIEQQQLRVVPTNVPVANYGMATEDYVRTNDSQFQPKLQMLPNNDKNSSWAEPEGWTQGEDGDYWFSSDYYWNVEAKAPEPKEGEEADWVGWSYANSFDQRIGEADQTVDQNKYRLKYNGIILNDDKHSNFNYTFEKYSIEDVKADNGEADAEVTEKRIVSEPLSTADITVNKAGEKTLTLKLPEKSLDVTETYDNTLKKDKIDLSGVKYVDSDNQEVTPQFIWEYTDGNSTYVVSEDEVIDSGEYYIYAKHDGDANYAPKTSELVATLTIEKAELTVSVKPFTEAVAAGQTPNDIFSDYEHHLKAGDLLTVEGFPANETEDVKNAFTQWTQVEGHWQYSYPAWTTIYDDSIDINQPRLVIYGSDQEKLDEYEYLKSGEKYTLNVDEDRYVSLASPYSNNYTMKVGKPVEITAAYVESEVDLYSYASGDKLTVADKITSSDTEKFVHDITFRESVPYTDAIVDGKTVYGHYATIAIIAPREFNSEVPETAFYENAMKNVENAGAIEVFVENGVIHATFDLSKDGENGLEPNPVTFSLVWKSGFVEKFTITPTQDNLAADLRKAVAPRSVAFNAPKTKMVVGEVQELDVKVTKVQNEDLVYLDYKIANGAPEDVLAVSSQGKITALKEGSTTVEVYPVRIVNNSKEQITSVKPAQAKITVSKVAAPKVGTVLPADVSVEVQYPYVKNNGKYYDYGYRREVYVMQENKKTVADFDTAIAAFEKTGDYKKAGLAAAPIYITNDAEKEIADELSRGIYTKWDYSDEICGLANGKNITLQVRVDGLTPKTPYTVYVRNVSAQRTVTNKDGIQKTVELSANGVPKDFKTTLGQVKDLVVTSEGEASTALLEGSKVDYYEYELTSGGAQLAATGFFSAVEDGVEQAERPDLSDGYPVPFADKTLKTKLLEPKLEYRMYQVIQDADGSWYYSDYDYYNENFEDWYADYYTAKYTKVDKKGKLKFTQPEALAIYAYDTVTKTESEPIIVKIKAEADSATGKSVTLKVGQTTPIVDLVAYKAGSVALDSASPYFTHDATAAGNEYLKVDADGNITPVMFDKAASKQTVTVTGTPTVSGAATVTIKELDPIKNLKINNLMDNSFVLDFAPSIYAEGYIVDIKNSVGNLIQRKYISQYDENNGYNDGFIWYYSEKKRGYVLFDNYKHRFVITGLKAKCKYNVTVTAVYGDAESKKVSKSVTTTKMPAWDDVLGANEYNAGMYINVFADGALQDNVSDYPFVSGNRYTLVADANLGAQYAVTDKLSWSSSDGKVAQVKAIGGTYSASIKALKAGTTTIEVKSGILKQTIARWRITVRSVGDAYNNAYFYDENEDLRGDGTDRYDTAEKIMLNVPTAVELAAGESKTFKFTAEEAGNYIVTKLVGMDNAGVSDSLYGMAKDQTRLIRVEAYDEPVSGTIIVEKVQGNSFADRTPIKLGETLEVSDSSYAVFTAEKDGLYRFGGSSSIALYEGENSPISGKSGNLVEYAMKANTTVYVKSNSYSTNEITVELINISSLETGKEYSVEGGYKTYWYTFKAPEKGDYRFTSENSNVHFDVYKDLDAVNDNNSLGSSCALDAEKTVYVKVYVSTFEDVSFEVIKVEPIVITKDQKVYSGKDGVLKNAETKYLLTPEADAIYTFALDNYARSIAIYSAADEETAIKSDTYTNRLSCPLVKGTTYSIKVNNTGNIDFTLTVEDTAINALSVDGEGKTFTSSNTGYGNNSAYLTFTVPENGDGTYKFDINNESSSYAYVYLRNEPSDNTTDYIKGITVNYSRQGTIECYLAAGKKVWLQLGSSSSSNIASNVSVTVKKAGGAIQPSDEADTVKAGEYAWFSYNVTENGRYRFSCTTSAGSTVLDCYADMDKQNNSVLERYWEAGSTVYLKVKNNNSTEDATGVKITANKIHTEAWTDATATQSISASETKWYAFTAGEEGEYQFVGENASGYYSATMYLYSQKQFEAENGGTSISGSSVIYPFAEGETVYLKVSAYSDVTLKAEKVEMQTLVDGENTVETVSGTTWVKFTVPKTSIYTFTPDENNRNGSLYLYADKESYVSDNRSQKADNGNSICYPLIEGTTAYLKIVYSNGDAYKLTVGMDDEIKEVKKGENPLTLTAGEDVWLYYLVADNDKSDDTLWLSYSSNDISSLSYGYASDFSYYGWKNQMSSGTWSQGYGSGWQIGDGKIRIIKLTSQNSGAITFNLKVGKN